MLLPVARLAAPIILLGLLISRAGLPARGLPSVALPNLGASASAALFLNAGNHLAADGPKLPDTPQGRCISDFIIMVANPTPDAVRKFETAWASKSRLAATAIDERIPRVAALADEMGKLSLTRIGAATPSSLT